MRTRRVKRNYSTNAASIVVHDNPGFDTRTMALIMFARLFPQLNLVSTVLDTFVSLLTPGEFETLVGKIRPYWEKIPNSKRMKANVEESELSAPDQHGTAVESLIECGAIHQRTVRELVGQVLKEAVSNRSDPRTVYAKQLQELCEVYRIDQYELECLLFLYTVEEQSDFSNLFDRLNMTGMLGTLGKAIGAGAGKARQLLSSRSRLVTMGLIDDARNSLRHSSFPDLDAGVHELLSGLVETGLRERFVKRDTGKHYPLAGFQIPAMSLSIMRDLLALEAPAQILLYGRPGTGKTELARSLAAKCNKLVYLFACDEENLPRRGTQRSALIAAADRVARDDGILIVDEADNLLQTVQQGFSFFGQSPKEDTGKEWINNFLDTTRTRIIWITNATRGIDESVKRRFGFSLKFGDFSRTQRLAMWRMQCREQKISLPQRELERLAAEYPVNAGTIATALKGIATVDSNGTQARLERIGEILSRQLELQGLSRQQDRTSTCRGYDADALRLDTDRKALETSLAGFAEALHTQPRGSMLSMNCLFWGPSGTGKTEYARHLAGLLGRELIFKRASDLFDPYVGMTEHKIREAFQSASQQDAILFIDEADSFLRTRDKASRSWELSFVNEFLTNMENFRGILICCTNLKEELDSASLRRFQWKVGFQILDAAGRQRLFRRYFHPRGTIPPAVSDRLDSMAGLVPGDFRAVDLRLGFLPDAARRPEMILAELDKERLHRKGKHETVGFAHN